MNTSGTILLMTLACACKQFYQKLPCTDGLEIPTDIEIKPTEVGSGDWGDEGTEEGKSPWGKRGDGKKVSRHF